MAMCICVCPFPGPMPMQGDGPAPTDAKQRADHKEGGVAPSEPPKPKVWSECPGENPFHSLSLLSAADYCLLSPYSSPCNEQLAVACCPRPVP